MPAPKLNPRAVYDRFDSPITGIDCGSMCAPHNPSGKPFCCDICHAVPAAYRQEWQYLQRSTDLWHLWRGEECGGGESAAQLQAQTPRNMLLLACKGPALCQRDYRALSCRQFPFFPYIDSAYRFLGLAYEWSAEPYCWVVSSLAQVTGTYRQEFIDTFDALFSQWPAEMDAYAAHSEEHRRAFAARGRRFPLLHRRGFWYLVSPTSERVQRTDPALLPRFGPYR